MAIKKQIGFNIAAQPVSSANNPYAGSNYLNAIHSTLCMDIPDGEEYYFGPSLAIARDGYNAGSTTLGAQIGVSPNRMEEMALSLSKVVAGDSPAYYSVMWGSTQLGRPKQEGKVYIGCRVDRNIVVSGSPVVIYGKYSSTVQGWLKGPNTSEIKLYIEFEIDFEAKTVKIFYNNTLVMTITMVDMKDLGIGFGNYTSATIDGNGAPVAASPILVANPAFMFISSYYLVHDKPTDAVKTGRLGPVRCMSITSAGVYSFSTPPTGANWTFIGNTSGSLNTFMGMKRITTNDEPVYPDYAIGKNSEAKSGLYGVAIDSPSQVLAISLYSQAISDDMSTTAASKLEINDRAAGKTLVSRVANVPLKSWGIQNNLTLDLSDKPISLSTIPNYEFAISTAKAV